jgi:S-DNA-T family DNA segregation ATPase FtsK/SpoIIIE
VGVLVSLGVYFRALGPAGSLLFRNGAHLLGFGLDVVPAALVVGGILLIAERSVWGALGTLGSGGLLVVGASGIADLAGGNPDLSATAVRLGGAGGLVGAAIGGGIAKGIGSAGSGVLLGALVLTACCWLLGGRVVVVLRAVVSGSWAGLRMAVGAARQSLTGRPDGMERHAAQSAEGARPGAGTTSVVATAPGVATALRTSGALYDGGLGSERHDGGGLDHGQDDGGDRDAIAAFEVAEAAEPAAVPGSGGGGTRPGAPATDGDLSASSPTRELAAGGMLAASAETDGLGGKAEQLSLALKGASGSWKLPPLKLLSRSKDQALDRKEVESRGRVLEQALAAHGVETHLVGFTVGPTVTRFELELGAGVKVARVTNLAKDIAYAMASPDVRILAPIPGRSAIGVEVPNTNRQLVTLGDVLASTEARRATHPLEVALGRDIAGRPVMANLAEMPHILIAGATGAGKSSCINSIISSILMRATPEEVRLILVDPKRVELGQYNGLPHLLTQVVVNPKRAANALSWAVTEMERRYDLLAEVGMRDITGYNAAVDRGELDPHEAEEEVGELADGELADGELGPADLAAGELDGGEPGEPGDGDGDGDGAAGSGRVSPTVAAAVAESRQRALRPEATRHQRLPFILIVVDELNDLMMVAARDVEESICRIAQMARAVGIHLVIATQRPSVDVITGVIKANVPSRLAFSVSSLADSRVILDQPGAERLIGRGDLLLLTASSSIPRRLQGPWVSEEEVRAIAAQWRRQSGPIYLDGVEGEETGAGLGLSGDAGDDNDLLNAAMELVVRSQLGSTSMLQRKLRVGFARAGRLMDLLERGGVVGPSEGSKARAVLMSVEELEQLQG